MHPKALKWLTPPLLAFGLLVPAGHVAAEPPVVIVVQDAPERVETYPREDYDGHPVYYVNGRWYYRDGGHWAYYRDAPPALRRHRERDRERAVREDERARAIREDQRAHDRHVQQERHERRDERREDRRDDRRGEREVYVAPRAR